jgi:hypothetical protein
MTSVAKKVNNNSTYQKEGTEIERVVLFFCFLFFVLQIGSSSYFSKPETQNKTTLRILPDNNLILSKVPEVESIGYLNNSTLFESYDRSHLAPLFFQPIPINFSNRTLLMSIRGIGPSLADNILQTRNITGGFTGPEDLLKINGVGPGRFEKFKSQFSF